MQKSLILLVLLLAVSLAGLVSAHQTASGWQDDVVIEETTEAGDPAAVAGLKVSVTAQENQKFFWRTVYDAAPQTNETTEFDWYRSFQSDSYVAQDSFWIYLGGTNFGIGGDFLDLEELESAPSTHSFEARQMIRPVIDVAGRTAPGETRTETLRLADYYDYFTVGMEFQFHGVDGRRMLWLHEDVENAEQTLDALEDFFRIPVAEDHMVEVSVSRNENGGIYNVDCHTVDRAQEIYSSGAVKDDGAYVVVVDNADGNRSTDLSQIKGGYGVYRISIDMVLWPEENTDGQMLMRLDTANIQNIYPLELNTQRATSIMENGTEDELVLFTEETEGLWLTVLNCRTGETLQRLQLPLAATPGVWQQDGLLLLHTYQEDGTRRLLVLTRENGGYRIWLDTLLHQWADEYRLYDPVIYFDGSRLVLAAFEDNWNKLSVRMQAFDQNGLTYAGVYHHNADTLSDGLENSWNDALVMG